MDVLSVRNVYEDAERAKDKKAAIGADVTIENFSDETVNALDMIDDLDDLSNQTKKHSIKPLKCQLKFSKKHKYSVNTIRKLQYRKAVLLPQNVLSALSHSWQKEKQSFLLYIRS
jgi:hypothetical protein